MGFNKRWVVLDRCIDALKEGKLKQYYGKSDMLHFEDDTSAFIHDLYCQGKSDEEIRKAGFQEKLYASDRIVCSNGFSTMR